MRALPALVLLAATLLAGEEYELALPEGVHWTEVEPDPAFGALEARFRTDLAEVQLTATDGTVETWSAKVTGYLGTVREKKTGKGDLGGEPATVLDLRGDAGEARLHLTSHIVQRGKLVYAFTAYRWNDAIGDEQLEKEIAAIRGALRFRPRPPETAREKEEAPPPEPRRKIELDFWRLRCVKPEGLVQSEKLDDREKKSGVVLRFDGEKEKSLIMVRVFAQTKRYRLGELARTRIEEWRKEGGTLGEPEAGGEWKLPLAKESATLRLARLRKSKEVTRWWFAECRNGRTYQLQIHVTGAHGENVWKRTVAEILDGFEPVR